MRQLALACAAACALLLACQVQGYAKGAPEGSCGDMVPQHGVDPQKSPSPYTLTPVKAKDGSVSLTLKGGKTFKGFLVQGRDASGKAVGSFKVTPGARTVDCTGPNSASGATHSGPEEKSSVSLTWEPKGVSGPITFWYTVAHNGGEFWVAQKTQSVAL
ncbi:Defense protein l(2)34Fc [Gryllus bimaculatus]|nr:Defense protein l(2)34Fc [Gryllus bimaculatus]